MAGDIFYSQLNTSLKSELLARSAAGKLDRSKKAMDFMLQKMANIRLIAYESDTTSKEIGTMGGQQITMNSPNGSYLPGGKDGYLANDSSRPGPGITGVEIVLADQTLHKINTATLSITIPDPEMLDNLEDIFFRPGRAVRVEIIQPDDTILNDDGPLLNQDESLYTTRILAQQYKDTGEDLDAFRKMNQLIFNGLVDGFKVDYGNDGTISVSLTTRSLFAIYTDVSMFYSTPKIPNVSIDVIKPPKTYKTGRKNLDGTDQETIVKFSDLIKQEVNFDVNRSVEEFPNGFIKHLTVLEKTPNESDRVLLYGPIYKSTDNQKYEYNTMISIGLLVDFIEKYLYEPATTKKSGEKPTVVPRMRITCNDQVSKTNYYDELVSADPKSIFLYQGDIATSKTNEYIYNPIYNAAGVSETSPDSNEGIPPLPGAGTAVVGLNPTDSAIIGASLELEETTTYNYYPDITNIDEVAGFYETGDKDPGKKKKTNKKSKKKSLTTIPTKFGCLSRILIAIDTITKIEDELRADNNKDAKPFTVKNFMIAISKEIKKQLGFSIFPGLVFHPELASVLLYYDQNYLGPDKVISEFTIPVFSSATQGTVVRDLKLGYDIPDNYKNLLFAMRSKNISPDKMSSYNPYLISISNKDRTNEQLKWTTEHEKAVEAVKIAKSDFTTDPYDDTLIDNLQDALKIYVKYSEPSLQKSLDQQKPRWLYTLEFTVDGINGFRFGDVLQFRGLPKKYNNDYIFCITKVTHKVNATGEWTTVVNCDSRARSTSII